MALALSVGGICAARGASYYVSTTGSDSNTGTDADHPFLKLQKALDKTSASGGTIYVAPGEYTTTDASLSAVPFTRVVDTNACKNCLWYSSYQITNAVSIVGTGTTPDDVVFKFVQSTDVKYRTINDKGVVSTNSPSARLFYLNHADAKLKNITITGGNAAPPNGVTLDGLNYTGFSRLEEMGGGNVYIDTAGGTVEDCVITKGTSGTWAAGGGNVQMLSGRLIRCQVTKGYQGATWTRRDPDKTAIGSAIKMSGGIVENSLIYNNGENNNAGTTILLQGTGKVLNCTIAGNNGYKCAGIAVQSANAETRNCAIFNNTCLSDSSGYGHVIAGIVNKSTELSVLAAGFHSCAADAYINDNCINSESGGFVDQTTGDYHLANSSCCRDKATDYSTSGAISTTDLDGLDRKMGESEDIGCYEFDTTKLAVDFNADVTEGIVDPVGGFAVNFTATLSGIYSGTQTFEWDFDGDGVVDEKVVGDNTIAHVYENSGTNGYFTVGLKVTVGSASATASKLNYIHIGPPEIYVATTSTGGEFPYDTEEKAAPNLYTALKAAITGATIYMAPGEYDCTDSKTKVEAGVRILGGTSNPWDTVIYNSKKWQKYVNAMLLTVNHASAFVANLTLKDGYVSSDGSSNLAGGLYIGGNGGTVSNCIITGCSSPTTAAVLSTAGIHMANGLLTHCIIESNTIYHVGAPTYNDDLNSRRMQALAAYGPAKIENCLFRDMNSEAGLILLGKNSDNAAPTMRNCTIVNCSVDFWTDNPGYYANRQQWPCAAIECLDGYGNVYNTAICNFRRRAYYDSNRATTIPADDSSTFSRNTRTFVPSEYGDLDTDARCCYNCASTGTNKINSTCLLMTTADLVDYAGGDFTPLYGGALNNTGKPISGWSKFVDLAGNRRVVDRIDIGCYEQQTGSPVNDVYVDCLFEGESTGDKESPYKTIREGCEAADQLGVTVYVRGGLDRRYVLTNYVDSITLSADSNSVIGCDAEWNPATSFTATNDLAVIAVADDYAQSSYDAYSKLYPKGTDSQKQSWPAPIVVSASSCRIAGFFAEFGTNSFMKANRGGAGLISIAAGVSGTVIENCHFAMDGDVGAVDGAGYKGIVSGAYINSPTASQVRDTLIRRCFIRMGKSRAKVCAFWNLHDGTRFEENLVENLDTLFVGTSQGGTMVYLSLNVISNIFLNCANDSPEGDGCWFLDSNGKYLPGEGEIAYNRFIHNDGSSGRYRLFQHGRQFGGNWIGKNVLIHHNTIVGYDIAFESPKYNEDNGTMWQPKIFDNIIVATAAFSEDASVKWKKGVEYCSSFLSGSMFRNNAFKGDDFVSGTAPLNSWYDIGEYLEGTNTTIFLSATPRFINSDNPLSENYYRLRVPQAPWVVDAYTGATAGYLEYPKYIGALPPQRGGFAARIR